MSDERPTTGDARSTTEDGRPALEILECPSCGAAVPFGDGEVAACVFCHAQVPLPPEYRELRRATHADENARRAAEEVLRKLDDPPWLITRVAAVALDQSMFAFLLFYGVPAGIYSILFALSTNARLARHLGYQSENDAPSAILWALVVLYLLLFTFVPRALGVYANRRATSRGALLAALAARPPKTPGGPSQCRTCGAPLFVTEGSPLSKCVYCRTENAVRLQTAVVQGARVDARRVFSTASEAAESDRKERRETRRALLSELGRYAFRGLVFAALFVTYAVDGDRPEVKASHIPGIAGDLALVGTVVAFFVFLFRSASRPDDDAAERRSGAGLPQWVGIVSPLGVWVILYVLSRM